MDPRLRGDDERKAGMTVFWNVVQENGAMCRGG